MAKDKKKKKKKVSSGGINNNFSQMMGQDKSKKHKAKATSAGELPYGVSLGNPIDRSTDQLFLGTDYREVLIPERSWADILADIEHWTPLPFTHGIEMELIIADDNGNRNGINYRG